MWRCGIGEGKNMMVILHKIIVIVMGKMGRGMLVLWVKRTEARWNMRRTERDQ